MRQELAAQPAVLRKPSLKQSSYWESGVWVRRKGFRGSDLGWRLGPGSGNVPDFRGCFIITVCLTPLENPETMEKPVTENVYIDKQYLAAKTANWELSSSILKNHHLKIFLKSILSVVTFLRC